jgi:tetratricopeptide (TPR) repeat protein
VTEEQIETLVQEADRAAGPALFGPITAVGVRQRVRRRRLVRILLPAAAAAVVLLGTCLMALYIRKPSEPAPAPQSQRIAALQQQIEQLQAQTDATLKLVRDVLAKDRQEQRLAALEAKLASIPDPVREVEQQVDETVFLLVYQADRLYKELNRTESAVKAYKEVIQLFPQNRWANVARERLSEIEQRQFNKCDEGEPQCELHDARSLS